MKKIPQLFVTFVWIVIVFDATKSITKAQEYFSYSDKGTLQLLEYKDFPASGTLVRRRRSVGSNATDMSSNSTDTVSGVGMDASTNGSNATSSPMTMASTTTAPFNTTTIRDSHIYYKSHIYNEPALSKPYLEMFQKTFVGVAPSHEFLRNTSRGLKLFKSSFKFLFYGHSIDSIAATTSGFAYMSDFLHPYLSHSQYIAPLMATFHTRNNQSDVYHVDDGSTFWILWKDMYLRDQESAGPFTFYMAIHKNGTIVFAYEKIPIPLTSITGTRKIGLSDAFYQDLIFAFSLRLRAIYRYHVLAIPPESIRTGTVVVLEALPTCHELTTCNECLAGTTNFTCQWCPSAGRCSSGIDRKRQDWLQKSCHLTSSEDNCNPIPSSAPSSGVGRTSRRKSGKGVSVPGMIAVGLLIVSAVAVIAGAGFWCKYAYSHPSSPSGIWLMEHRPSVMKEKMANLFKSSDAPGERYHVSFNTHESVA